MIQRFVVASFEKPVVAILLVIACSAFGVVTFRSLPRDVFPDLSAPVFNVIVQNPAMGSEELETRVAIPIETALSAWKATGIAVKMIGLVGMQGLVRVKWWNRRTGGPCDAG